jgi:hypothetical protein
MAIAAAHTGMFGAKLEGASRELTAIGRAREWLNSPRLTPSTRVRLLWVDDAARQSGHPHASSHFTTRRCRAFPLVPARGIGDVSSGTTPCAYREA